MVEPDQFRRNVRSLGVEATDEELDVLFTKFDEDGGGTLGIYELKGTLMTLRNVQREVAEEHASLASKWRAINAAHAEFYKAQLVFEAGEVKEAQREKSLAEEFTIADRAAKKLQQKEHRKEEETAMYEAKNAAAGARQR